MARPSDKEIGSVRRFNRFYRLTIGSLQDGVLYRPYSLAESRVLYEIGSSVESGASGISKLLDMDEAYLSRILAKFVRTGLVKKRVSSSDQREHRLQLTKRGESVLADLNKRSDMEVGKLLAPLSTKQRKVLVSAMQLIEQTLTQGLE